MLKEENFAIISVIGPTASGKTALASNLARHFLEKGRAVDFVSLDTRQIYRALPILSGADPDELPQTENLQTYNLLTKEIDEEWSLGELVRETQEIIARAERENRQVLLVGGTLLYHQRVSENNDLTQVPPDDNLRFAAENMNLAQLQDWLKKIDENEFFSLNESDAQNPRRLVRKIEIAIYEKMHAEKLATPACHKTYKHYYVQPHYDFASLAKKITERVQARFIGGAIDEVQAVIRKDAEILSNKNWLSRMPLGFREIAQYLAGEIDAAECQRLWSLHEWQYAKRQKTFLQKLLLDDHTHLVDEREILTD
ncbi:MAG: hypothetical protein Q4G02_00770 [bacterium]|nr:hypothetical protein [bacterium]